MASHRNCGDKLVSSYVIGTHALRNKDFPILDSLLAKGVNAFHCTYGVDKKALKGLGEWLRSRSVDRAKVFIMCKATFSDSLRPEKTGHKALTSQLQEMIAPLGVDYIDLFFVPRDGDSVKVEFLLEVANQALASGLCRSIGTADWRFEDICAVNEHARASGLIPFKAGLMKLSPLSHDEGPSVEALSEWALENDFSVFAHSHLNPDVVVCDTIRDKVTRFALSQWAKQMQCPVDHAIFRYLRSHRAKPHVVVGARKFEFTQTVLHLLSEELMPCESDFDPHAFPGQDGEPLTAKLLSDGFIQGFCLSDISSTELSTLADEVKRFTQTHTSANFGMLSNWHNFHPIVSKILQDKSLNETIEKVFGQMVLYNTELFIQETSLHFSYTKNWHTDDYLTFCKDFPHFTVQVALTRSTADNCVAFVPESHVLPAAKDADDNNAPIHDLSNAQKAAVHKMLVSQGECYLFSNDVIHSAHLDSSSASTRVMLTLRLTYPEAVFSDTHKIGRRVLLGKSLCDKQHQEYQKRVWVYLHKLRLDSSKPKTTFNRIWKLTTNIFKFKNLVRTWNTCLHRLMSSLHLHLRQKKKIP